MNKYLKFTLFIALIIAFFILIQSKIFEFLGVDAYYHAKVAQLILESGNLLKSYPWLQYTILNENFVEHHLLFHILLLPFFSLFQPFIAAKIAVTLFGSLFFLTFFIILKKLKIKFPYCWTLFLAFSSSLLIYRLNLLRAQSIALILLFVGIYFLLRKKYWHLLPLTIFYTWLFDGFIILGIVILIKLIIDIYFLIKKRREKFLNIIMPSISYLLGISIAILFNPYFPRNIYHLFFHLYQVALKDPFSKMPVGVEWHYSSPELLFYTSGIIIFSFACLIFFFIIKNKASFKINKHVIFLMLTSIIFIILTIMTRKMIEYSAPIIIFSLAYFISQNFQKFQKLIISLPNKIKYFLFTFILLLILILGSNNYLQVYNNLSNDIKQRQDTLEALEWVKANINDKIIYHPDWSESALFTYYNDKNYYIAGLDPNFIKEYDSDLYQKWYQIFSQQDLYNIYEIIKLNFKANNTIIKKNYQNIIKHIENDARFRKIYENNLYVIYMLQ